jgi:hypothetical protein
MFYTNFWELMESKEVMETPYLIFCNENGFMGGHFIKG